MVLLSALLFIYRIDRERYSERERRMFDMTPLVMQKNYFIQQIT